MSAAISAIDTTPSVAADRLRRFGKEAGRWAIAYGAAMAAFAVFVVTKGANPLHVYSDMWQSTFTNGNQLAHVVVKACPFILAGLAVAVPARAGLVNVGGEGQIVVGAVAAAGVGLALDGRMSGAIVMVLMLLAAAAAGAVWAAFAGLLRLTLRVNEAITTLLLNYAAIDLMLYLVYAPWKDAHGSGQPTTRALAVPARLSVIGTTGVNAGIFIALIATGAVWFAFRRTSWGFRLRVVGGNAEAARRAGLPVGALLLSAMAVGGALAGLGGFVHFAGTEFKLRPGMTANFGYIAFLASWLARHKPLRVAVAGFALAAIAVGGDSLQIDSGLPAATVNILMAVVLLAAMGGARRSAVTA